MPLYPNAIALIREQLRKLSKGERASLIAIGTLSDEQRDSINRMREARRNHLGDPAPFPPLDAEIVMIGRHLYNSRVVKDGYTIEEVLLQIVNALDQSSRHIQTQRATLLQNPVSRTNPFGETIRDEAVLECSAKYPRPELFSVIPKGELAPNERKATSLDIA